MAGFRSYSLQGWSGTYLPVETRRSEQLQPTDNSFIVGYTVLDEFDYSEIHHTLISFNAM